MRHIVTKKITLAPSLKEQFLTWAQQFEEVIWLDSNNHLDGNSSYRAILAVDAFTAIKTDAHQAFDKLEEYQSLSKDWLFGYLSYDLKNDVECLTSVNYDGLDFPDLYFFQPKKVFLFSEHEVIIQYLKMIDDEIESDWEEILKMSVNDIYPISEAIKIRLRTSKDSYTEKVSKMLHHIERGDIYEANFCQEFYAENVSINPLRSFIHLNEIATPPFATFLKLDNHFALSSSPERYLHRCLLIVLLFLL